MTVSRLRRRALDLREPEATRDLAELGGDVAETAADAARQAAIVVTIVSDTDAVISIARDQGMVAALPRAAIGVQMSTIGVARLERVAALVEAERPDVPFIDAPVSRSNDPAAKGQFTIFASGEAANTRSPVAPLLDALVQSTIWVGPAGAGTRLKIVNAAQRAKWSTSTSSMLLYSDVAVGASESPYGGVRHPGTSGRRGRFGKESVTLSHWRPPS
jgi:3-hydroxyisobutyrate dehydrogenase